MGMVVRDRDSFPSESFFKWWFICIAVVGVAFLVLIVWAVISLVTWLTSGGLNGIVN